MSHKPFSSFWSILQDFSGLIVNYPRLKCVDGVAVASNVVPLCLFVNFNRPVMNPHNFPHHRKFKPHTSNLPA